MILTRTLLAEDEKDRMNGGDSREDRKRKESEGSI